MDCLGDFVCALKILLGKVPKLPISVLDLAGASLFINLNDIQKNELKSEGGCVLRGLFPHRIETGSTKLSLTFFKFQSGPDNLTDVLVGHFPSEVGFDHCMVILDFFR